MIKILHITALALLVLSLFSPVQAEVKDSFYFMKDDNFFSDEEKDEEAEYIHRQCERSTFQHIYYDCACMAGAFRVKRDAEKLIPQDQILEELLDDKESPCVNTAAIAGETYKFCYDYVSVFHSRDKNNVKYCKCVANKTAHSFKKKPVLESKNIEKIRSKAMQNCRRNY
jgi:hypothetical protein